MDELKKQLELIERLIDKTEDAEELKALAKQRDEILVKIGKAEAEVESKAVRLEMETKAAASRSASVTEDDAKPDIKIVRQGEYRGHNLKAAAAIADRELRNRNMGKIADKFAADPDRAERMMKMWVDKWEQAMNRQAPMGQVKADMQEGTTTEGGFLVPDEQRTDVLSYIRDTSVAMQDAFHVPMTRDTMTIPRENATVTMTFTAEETEATQADPTFTQVSLSAKRLDGYTVSSNELIEDAANAGGIAGLLMAQFTEAMGKKIDEVVFQGDGSAADASHSGVLTAKAGYSEVFSEGSTAFSEILESNLRNIVGKIPARFAQNAKWYIAHDVLWQYIYGLQDGDNRALFLPSYVTGQGNQLLGYPVSSPTQVPGVSSSGADTGFISFADLKGVYIGDRLTNIDLFVDPYTRSTKHQTLFLMFTRWAFANALPNMLGRIVTGSAAS